MPVTKPEPRYDVFISYRRGTANALALLLQTQLQRQGIAAFLDRDLRRGVFDDMLLRRIAESPSFLIILTPHALDGCSNEEDWLRKEIVQAISSKRNIIPLQVDSFQFTPELVKSLDPAIRELSRYQTVVYSHDYFENTVERIVKIVEEDKAERTAIQEAEAAEEKRSVAEGARSRSPEPGPNLVAGVRSPLEVATPAGTIKINPKDGQKYVWIPPGTFQMGCSAGDNECVRDEKPAHSITITKGFWLGQTPVTQAAYQRVTGDNPSNFRGEQLPVEQVTWDQAKAYCKAVGGRLPTEAEWEYAARAGSDASRYGDLDAIAWYYGNSEGKTHEVGLKQANRWGLHDMLGNVWEWVRDWYDEKYYEMSPSTDPSGPASAKHRVLRGGSWFSGSRTLRSSYRAGFEPDVRNLNVGFRCAREVFP
jgi:formylglycine-generating enzyme required for sulfatase activity